MWSSNLKVVSCAWKGWVKLGHVIFLWSVSWLCKEMKTFVFLLYIYSWFSFGSLNRCVPIANLKTNNSVIKEASTACDSSSSGKWSSWKENAQLVLIFEF